MISLDVISMRLPSAAEGLLGELGAAPPFAGAPNPELPRSLAAWAREARQQPVSALDWLVVLAAATAPPAAGSKATQQLAALLGWAAEAAAQELMGGSSNLQLAAADSADAVPAPPADAGNPRRRLTLQNSFKLSLAFLCCLARGEGCAGGAAQPAEAGAGGAGGRQTKKAKGGAGEDAAAAALSALQARCDALQALGRVAAALAASGGALLPGVADLRSSERLVRGTALHCLLHPLAAAAGGGERGGKAAAEACHHALAGILTRPLLEAAAGQRRAPAGTAVAASAAAGATLHELLEVVSAPKQAPQVLSAVARMLAGLAQQCSHAGLAVVGRLVSRCEELAADSSAGSGGAAGAAAGLAGLRLDACLSFAAAMLAAPGGGATAAPLLLCLPRLLPLARSPRGTTRRLVLDVCSGLLPAAAQRPVAAPRQPAAEHEQPAAEHPGEGASGEAGGGEPAADCKMGECRAPEALQTALLAALAADLSDKDATLRAKALACLERHSALLAAHLSACTAAGGGSSSSAGAAVCNAWLAALCGRLCDKSPSVRKRAVALLAGLTEQPRTCLSPAAAARLADAALPVASALLGLRPDSALHPGEEGVQALSGAVLRLAASGSSSAGLLPLLCLAGAVGEAGARAQLQAAVLDVLLPHGAPATGEALLAHLASAGLHQWTASQVRQLRDAVQSGLAARGSSRNGAGQAAATAAGSAAVRLCYQRVHAAAGDSAAQASAHWAEPAWSDGWASSARGPAGSADKPGSSNSSGAPAGGSADAHARALEVVESTAAALFVLGPFSAADEATRVAEAGLLLGSLGSLSSTAGSGSDPGKPPGAAGVLWVLATLELALQQLPAPASPAGSQQWDGAARPEEVSSQRAAAELVQALPGAVHSLLLSSAGSSSAVRQAALQALAAAPEPAALQLRLLRSLAAAAAADGQPPPVPGPGLDLGRQLAEAVAASAGDAGEAEDHAAFVSSQEQRAQQQAQQAQQAQRRRPLVALLELLGSMAAGYERQRASFLHRLLAEAEPRAAGAEQHTSKAGRPLRPAGEWWVGECQQGGGGAGGGGAAEASGAEGGAAADAGQPEFEYMRGEDQASKHEAAAQRFLESLLDAADTPPACYLPLLCELAAPGAPPAVQAAALRSLGKLAVLSEPLCRHAAELAEACLRSSGSGSAGDGGEGSAVGSGGSTADPGYGSTAAGRDAGGMCNEVQEAAVAVLAAAIDAFPSAYGGRLALIGRLMVAPLAGGQGGALADRRAEQLARAAACAYCRLLTRNKLRLQDAGMLRPLGCALAAAGGGKAGGGASAGAAVAALARHALAQLLAGASPKDRARLALAVFHQTPLEAGWRRALAEELTRPGRALLPEADLRGDMLVGQAAQALLAADSAASAEAAGALLQGMRPSAKVLGSLLTQLLSGGGAGGGGGGGGLLGKLPAAARRALAAFVGSHVPDAAPEAAGDGAPAQQGGGGGAAAQKRKRGKASSAALQQQLLGLLGGSGGGRQPGRPPRAGRPAGSGPPASSAPSVGAPASSEAITPSGSRGAVTPSASRWAGGSTLRGGAATAGSSRRGR